MTPTLAVAHFVLAAASKSSSSSLLTLLPLVAIGLLGYFFFIRPQQRKAQAARQTQGSGYDVGDEVQTVGGVIGTVLEVHGDRYTLLTGALGDDGNLDGPQPTRIVFVRQAIAKKIEPIDDVRSTTSPSQDVKPRDEQPTGRHQRRHAAASMTTTSTTSVGTVPPAAATTVGRPKRREPEVGGTGPAASTTQPAHQRDRRGGDLRRLLRRRVRRQVVARAWGSTSPGGVAVVYTAEGQHVSQADLDETVNILNLRVNGLGVSGAQVQTTGKNQISVSIPGVTDAQQVLNQIGQTARMYFRPVECCAYPQAVPKGAKNKRPPRRASGRFPPVRRRRS